MVSSSCLSRWDRPRRPPVINVLAHPRTSIRLCKITYARVLSGIYTRQYVSPPEITDPFVRGRTERSNLPRDVQFLSV